MASTFYLEILTPEKKFFWGDVESIIVKTPTGEMGVLKGHVPMVVVIDIGTIKIKRVKRSLLVVDLSRRLCQEKMIISFLI